MGPFRTSILVGASAMLALAAGLTAADGQLTRDPRTALSEGNRLFRQGEIEAAVAAYLEGHSDATPHPTLAYNLGTALHHLGRLPEAILWYRRAFGSGDPSRCEHASDESRPRPAGDPWLRDNLSLARRSLGSRSLQPGGLLGWLCCHTGGVRLCGIALSWLTLVLVVARYRPSRRGTREKPPRWALADWALVAAAVLALAVYGGALAVERWGPQPAVILEDCLGSAAELPAGTELWVRPTSGGWSISGSGNLICPPDAVELVFPR